MQIYSWLSCKNLIRQLTLLREVIDGIEIKIFYLCFYANWESFEEIGYSSFAVGWGPTGNLNSLGIELTS